MIFNPVRWFNATPVMDPGPDFAFGHEAALPYLMHAVDRLDPPLVGASPNRLAATSSPRDASAGRFD
jgi:hypothetical protein